MQFDKLGLTPGEYVDLHPDARCPECNGLLIKKAGGSSKVIEHWAHKADPNRVCAAENYTGEETFWHMEMKKAFRDEGAEVEKTVMVNGTTYRVDAVYKGVYIEFINTLSRSYIQKTKDFVKEGKKLVWIFNGSKFADLAYVYWELPGKPGRFSKWCEKLDVDCYVLIDGMIVGIKEGRAVKHRGLCNAGRAINFLKNNFTSWMWHNLSSEHRTDKSFFTNKAYVNPPVCKNSNDYCNLIQC